MGLLNKLFGKKKSLKSDILAASDWIVTALQSSGYNADYSLESMKEIDRFFDEQNTPSGILAQNRGGILFALGSYVGQTAIKLYGGEWDADDNAPNAEINIKVCLADGSIIYPVVRCMNRYQLGAEESIYAYLALLSTKNDKPCIQQFD